MYAKLAEPITKIDDSLQQFGEVAVAIADCDERHEVGHQLAVPGPYT